MTVESAVTWLYISSVKLMARQGALQRRLESEGVIGVSPPAVPGVAIVIAAWMLDPAICTAMSLGSPTVDINCLTDLDRLLRALELRRACSSPTRGR